VHLEVPHFAELSVKSLYQDALAEDTLKMYLPSKKQLSNKLPEREFFFGLVGTLKRHWLQEVIKAANEKRNKASESSQDKNHIVISQSWMNELTSHPYYSRNINHLSLFRQARHRNSSAQREGKITPGALCQQGVYDREASQLLGHKPRGGKAKWKETRQEAESGSFHSRLI
jgi:hypothetical protein